MLHNMTTYRTLDGTMKRKCSICGQVTNDLDYVTFTSAENMNEAAGR